MSDKSTTDIPSELIALQRAADGEFAKVRASQEHGRTSEWTDEQHSAWKAQWEAWRAAAEAIYEAVCTHPAAAEMGRHALEMAVKAAVRHPAPTASHELAE
ncbi:hypothetical protein [Streptomyces olivoreticuli]|uniref:hypothetical protein n=1 Tax=Streptomyces olivoreticuli TaxID=68246 RepID=UPI000E231A6E|nr:hypothetical protein [Streptomyces olivoreticuli]